MGLLSSVKGLFGDNASDVINASDENAVKTWLLDRLARHLKKNVKDLDSAKPFDQYGLDSMFAVQITGELEKVVELRLSPALLFENTCIDDVARVIAESAKPA